MYLSIEGIAITTRAMRYNRDDKDVDRQKPCTFKATTIAGNTETPATTPIHPSQLTLPDEYPQDLIL